MKITPNINYIGQSQHCSAASIEFCKNTGISLILFPPVASYRLHTLNVAVNGLFKKYCSIAFHEWRFANPGKMITIYNIAQGS